MFKLKLPKQNQGFTLLEVLVAIIVITIFVVVTMNAMVLAIYFKVRAREYTEGVEWIQQDLETQRQLAASYQYTKLSAQANLNDTTITVPVTTDFQNNDTLHINTDINIYTVTNVTNNSTTTTLTITPNIQTVHLVNEVVAGTKKCGTSSSPATITTGFGSVLEGKITNQTPSSSAISNNIAETSKFSGNFFTMKRTTTIVNIAPYNQLLLTYAVVPKYGSYSVGSSTASMEAQLVSNASLLCP